MSFSRMHGFSSQAHRMRHDREIAKKLEHECHSDDYELDHVRADETR